jgi:glutaryl-CoA dehydrogenase
MEPVALDRMTDLDSVLTDDEKLTRDTVRQFVAEKYLPIIADHFENHTFPDELAPEIGALGVLGASIKGYGCAGVNAVTYGLILQELDHGSDPGSMRTMARIDGDSFVLNGSKMWITNSPVADVAVVWAKLEADDAKAIRGFLVERGTPGFETPPIKRKMSLRASHTGEIVLSDCRIPKDNLLPESRGLGAPLSCLNQARFGISWGAMGAAKACFDAALAYSRERVQFGVPIASKQLIQEQLVEMALEISKAQIMNYHFARLKDEGQLSPYQVSMAKKNSVAQALKIARMARSIHGAAGISLEFPAIRHMLNLESVYTYEGTDEMHTLIIGRALTGMDAF